MRETDHARDRRSMGTEYDILIENGLVLTLGPDAAAIPRGFVAVKGQNIVAVGSMDETQALGSASKVIDATRHLVMPGLVNAHTHAAMTAFRGLADDLPLMTWLNEHIFPAEAAHVGPELVYWATKLALAEMIQSGTTCVVDGYFCENEAARAVSEVGLRAVLAQGVVDFPAPGVPDPAKNIEAARAFIERWQGVSERLAPSVFCHAPYTCSASTLKRGKALARQYGVLFQIHVAETRSEVEQMISEQGVRPVTFLDRLGLLDEKTLAVHCVHADAEEVALLAARGTPVAVCTESNMKLASGLAPLPAMLRAGVKVALGTDGPASNNDLNMFGEMRAAALMHKVAAADPTALPASQVVSLAVDGGAAALGMGDRIGRLAPGYRADLILLDLDRPNLQPLYRPRSHLVYAATGREVKTVIVDGRILMEDGRLTCLDLEETMSRMRTISNSIKSYQKFK